MPERSHVRVYTILKWSAAVVAALTPIVTLIVTFGPLPGQVNEIKQKVDGLVKTVSEIDGGLRARGLLSDSGQQRERIADASPSHNAD